MNYENRKLLHQHRQELLATIDRVESEARAALAGTSPLSKNTPAYTAIIQRCAERRARLLGPLQHP